MKTEFKTTVQINGFRIKKKIEQLADDPVLMLAVHNLFAKMCDPYVPFLEGPLSQTINVTPEYVQYTQPYAHYQYVGVDFNHTIDYHPLATAYWDKVMLADHRDEFIAQVKDLIKWRLKTLG